MAKKSNVFSDAARRREERYRRLESAPTVTVKGVVSPMGSGGGMLGEDLWQFSCNLEAWRLDNAAMQTSTMSVCRRVPHDELRALMKKFASCSIIRMRARVLVDATNGTADAELLEVLRNSKDDELQQFARKLQEPVTIDDKRFGRFTLDRRVNWYSTSRNLSWGRCRIELTIDAVEPTDWKKALSVANAIFDKQREWKQRIEEFAVAKLLPLKNRSWLRENEGEVTARKFVSQMTLESITIRPDGTFEFWHNDGDLFWGHSIQISGDIKQGPTHADIPG